MNIVRVPLCIFVNNRYHHHKSVHCLFANDDVASKVIVYLRLFIKTYVFKKALNFVEKNRRFVVTKLVKLSDEFVTSDT